MGYRSASVYIPETGDIGREDGIYVHTNLYGDVVPLVVQTALARAERWGDAAYLVRVVLCELLKRTAEPLERNMRGFAISVKPCADDRPCITMDAALQEVSVVAADYRSMKEFSFAEYEALSFAPDEDAWACCV